METDHQRQTKAFYKLTDKWLKEKNFANGYFAVVAKEYNVPIRPLKKRFNEWLEKGYDISVDKIGGEIL